MIIDICNNREEVSDRGYYGIKCMERTAASSEKDIQLREPEPTSATEPGQPFSVR